MTPGGRDTWARRDCWHQIRQRTRIAPRAGRGRSLVLLPQPAASFFRSHDNDVMTENSSAPGSDGARNGGRKPGEESLTRLIAPIFAAFSLPTIISFTSGTYPGQPWHDVILSLLIVATGFFMAIIQLSIGPLYDKYPKAGSFRTGLTIFGIVCVTFALFFLVRPVIDRGWLWLPSGVLLAGGVAPGIWILCAGIPGVLRRSHDRPSRQAPDDQATG
jgi:hypothetical protein